MKSKGVTTQMKVINELFLLVVFTLLLNRVHVFANFMLYTCIFLNCKSQEICVKSQEGES